MLDTRLQTMYNKSMLATFITPSFQFTKNILTKTPEYKIPMPRGIYPLSSLEGNLIKNSPHNIALIFELDHESGNYFYKGFTNI